MFVKLRKKEYNFKDINKILINHDFVTYGHVRMSYQVFA